MAINPPISRRMLLACTAGAALWTSACGPVSAGPMVANPNRKLAFILLRGAADGLALLPPVGDPRLAGLRGALAQDPGQHRLNDFFALHSGLPEIAKLAAKKEALFFHAVGLTNPSRSHFDAQNLLETGGAVPYSRKTGVLNTMLELGSQKRSGLALANAIPPALRGPGTASSYAPDNSRGLNADLYSRIAGMYAEEDPRLAQIWQTAVSTREAGLAAEQTMDGEANRIGALAAQFLTRSDGFDVVMIESIGWDTHSNQHGRLKRQVSSLNAIVAGLNSGMGDAWSDTLVIIASEFGRTAATNGNGGTDHGTANALFALGGALPQTGVLADWPGLSSGQLFENRDLRTTAPIESVISGLASHHFGTPAADVAKALYPDLVGLKPVMF